LRKKFEFELLNIIIRLFITQNIYVYFIIKKMRERKREREREREKKDLLRYLDIQRNLFVYVLQTMKMYFKKDSRVYNVYNVTNFESKLCTY